MGEGYYCRKCDFSGGETDFQIADKDGKKILKCPNPNCGSLEIQPCTITEVDQKTGIRCSK